MVVFARTGGRVAALVRNVLKEESWALDFQWSDGTFPKLAGGMFCIQTSRWSNQKVKFVINCLTCLSLLSNAPKVTKLWLYVFSGCFVSRVLTCDCLYTGPLSSVHTGIF